MKLSEIPSELMFRASIQGLDESDLAKKSGVTKAAIKTWLQNKVSPTIGKLESVVNACGYEINVTLVRIDK